MIVKNLAVGLSFLIERSTPLQIPPKALRKGKLLCVFSRRYAVSEATNVAFDMDKITINSIPDCALAPIWLARR